MEECWNVKLNRFALTYPTILLHDGTTELVKKMYLSADPEDCFFDGTVMGDRGNADLKAGGQNGVADVQKCRDLCLGRPDCVIYIHDRDNDYCIFRRDRAMYMPSTKFSSGFKYCGTLYYESESFVSKGWQTATFSKNLDNISLALDSGRFAVRECLQREEDDCYVLLKYRD